MKIKHHHWITADPIQVKGEPQGASETKTEGQRALISVNQMFLAHNLGCDRRKGSNKMLPNIFPFWAMLKTAITKVVTSQMGLQCCYHITRYSMQENSPYIQSTLKLHTAPFLTQQVILQPSTFSYEVYKKVTYHLNIVGRTIPLGRNRIQVCHQHVFF